MRREDRRKVLMTSPLLPYSETNDAKHRIWAPSQTKLICAFQHHLLSRIICLWLPMSNCVDIHEVNCYSNLSILPSMMTTTFNSPHVFHSYAQDELVVYADSDHITCGHHSVLPADRHDPTIPCYHTDAPRHPFDRISRWLLCCTCTASNFLIREVYRSSWSERSHELY